LGLLGVVSGSVQAASVMIVTLRNIELPTLTIILSRDQTLLP